MEVGELFGDDRRSTRQIRQHKHDIFNMIVHQKQEQYSNEIKKQLSLLPMNNPLYPFLSYPRQPLQSYLLILFMQDKTILNEFAAKITKAKILHDNTQAACQKLRREAAQLEKEYHTIRSQREAAENMEKSLKNQLAMTQNAEKETAAKCRREEAQLQELRQNRKKLKREKQIEQHTLLKNKLQLEELVTKRQQLQATAKSLSEKLEGVTSEKEVLQEEYNKTEAAIKRYNENIVSLEAEIQKMREVITTNTVPVYNATESQLAQSPN